MCAPACKDSLSTITGVADTAAFADSAAINKSSGLIILLINSRQSLFDAYVTNSVLDC